MAEPSRALAAEYSARADFYDRYWGSVIHPMAAPLLAELPLAGASRILDIGTGTGALWAAIQRAAPRAELWGVDRAEGMLRAGGGFLRGRVAVMDATRLGVRSGAFDAALFLYVLFHVPDPAAALREARGALRPEGVVGAVIWGVDPGLPGNSIWEEELDRAGAAPDPRGPAVMLRDQMDSVEKVSGLFESGGFPSARVWSRRFVHDWTPDRLAATQVRCGLASRRLGTLPAEMRQEYIDRVRARLDRLTPDELRYEVEVIYGIARRVD